MFQAYFVMFNDIIGLGSSQCLYKPSPSGKRLWYDMTESND